MSNQAPANMVSLTYIIYGLHLASVATGLMTTAFIVTAFLTGWPSILAVILNYFKRADVEGTYLESHFSWQIRTFWFTALWLFIASVMFMTVILIPVAWVLLIMIGVWVGYRMVRGIMGLLDSNPMPIK